MSRGLTEDQVIQLTDLFEACELLEEHNLDLNGVACVEDAKCRLLKYLQELEGNGLPNSVTVSIHMSLFDLNKVMGPHDRYGMFELFNQ